MQRYVPIDGMTEFVSGAGGHSHYEFDRQEPRHAFANDTDYGALRVELRPGSASFEFITWDGRVLDSGRVSCRGEQEDPPRLSLDIEEGDPACLAGEAHQFFACGATLRGRTGRPMT
jgi:hypothetical protein